MKTVTLATLGIAGALALAGCAKKAVVAKPSTPAPTQQAAAAPARTQPTPSRTPVAPKQEARNTPTPQRSKTIPPEVRKTLNDSLARLEDALFDYDKSTIRSDATTALKDDSGVIRDILASYPSQKLVIEGHCDERGSEEYNMALGDRRARAAEEFLVTMGVSTNQLSVVSFGKDHPVCTDNSEACYQRNRRAHLTAAP
ncbi:MAG TPA: OmpA family protein [Bryobacteraceae bacterium]|nr:OmpA family protein [Bryobacteraceae bacterium]